MSSVWSPPTTTHGALVQLAVELGFIGVLVIIAGQNPNSAKWIIGFLVILWILALMNKGY